ncbi:hypothetical protein Athai_58560 [Actinocatenispora thailandica]|uniref:Uncharacterized protein n=1 Tax=Actinocatenispora thailandica TaxID=227318 RepID=A0A7R7DV06_9ACTN|nr:hypothetical protein Athai_58560 [Actinocatenispora thailandica]
MPAGKPASRPAPSTDWRKPMERYQAIVRALGRVAARIRTWRDEIADRPIDPDGWWR